MEKQPILATGRLLLRPFDLADARAVQRLCGDYAVAATTLLPHPYPDGLAEAWIASFHEGVERGDAAAFAVTLAGEGSLIGGVRLRIDPAHALGPGVRHRGGPGSDRVRVLRARAAPGPCHAFLQEPGIGPGDGEVRDDPRRPLQGAYPEVGCL